MRIAHLGTFDVENYGDLLFPAILQRCLELPGLELVPVSPRGGPGIWADGQASIGFREFLERARDFDGIVVGGGNILHCHPTTLEAYASSGLRPFLAYADFWLGAAAVAAQHNLPLCWNAPGVSVAPDQRLRPLIDWALECVDYMSVRDQESYRLLGSPEQCRVVPDTGLEVSRLWSRTELGEAYAQAYLRRGAQAPQRSFVVHFKQRYLNESLEQALAHVQHLAGVLQATPIFLAIGPCHHDDQLALAASTSYAAEHLLVERPHSLREVAALICGSVAYVGASLHGMITACAFEVPGLLVASHEVAKFQGLLSPLQLERWMVPDWETAAKTSSALMQEAKSCFAGVRARAEQPLSAHWSELRRALKAERRPKRLRTMPQLSGAELFGEDGWRGLGYEEAVLHNQALLLFERTRQQAVTLAKLRESKVNAEQNWRKRAKQAKLKQEEQVAELARLRLTLTCEALRLDLASLIQQARWLSWLGSQMSRWGEQVEGERVRWLRSLKGRLLDTATKEKLKVQAALVVTARAALGQRLQALLALEAKSTLAQSPGSLALQAQMAALQQSYAQVIQDCEPHLKELQDLLRESLTLLAHCASKLAARLTPGAAAAPSLLREFLTDTENWEGCRCILFNGPAKSPTPSDKSS